MSRKLFANLILLIFFCFFSVGKVFAADVVINEVFANPSGDSSEDTEFIELYNKSGNSIDISNWKVSDGANKTYTISGSISGNGYLSFAKSTSNISLNNNGGETVTLKDSSDQIIDSMSFEATVVDKSWSRIPNGTGDFVNNTDKTQDAANSSPPPPNTPTPTDVPTPTKTPTPQPTAKNTPTKTPVPSKTITIAPTPTDDPDSDLKLASNVTNNVFGNDSDISPTQEPQVLGSSTSSLPLVFMGLGLIFLVVCGILAYFQFGSKIFLWKKEKNTQL